MTDFMDPFDQYLAENGMDECLFCNKAIDSLDGIRLITVGFGVMKDDGMPTEDVGVIAIAHIPCVLSRLLDGDYREGLENGLLRVVEASGMIQGLAKPPLEEVHGD